MCYELLMNISYVDFSETKATSYVYNVELSRKDKIKNTSFNASVTIHFERKPSTFDGGTFLKLAFCIFGKEKIIYFFI